MEGYLSTNLVIQSKKMNNCQQIAFLAQLVIPPFTFAIFFGGIISDIIMTKFGPRSLKMTNGLIGKYFQ